MMSQDDAELRRKAAAMMLEQARQIRYNGEKRLQGRDWIDADSLERAAALFAPPKTVADIVKEMRKIWGLGEGYANEELADLADRLERVERERP